MGDSLRPGEARFEHERAQVARVAAVPAFVLDGALEEARCELELGPVGRDHDRFEVVVADRGEAARAEDALELDEGAERLAEVEEDGVRVDDVERGVVEGQLVDGGGGELGVVDPALRGRGSGDLDLLRVDVDPEDAPRGDRGREVERDAPDATARVEHVQARLQVGQKEREEGPGIPHPDVPLLDALLDDVALHGQEPYGCAVEPGVSLAATCSAAASISRPT